MRISTSNIIGACLSAAILAACGGGNNGLLSSTLPSAAQPLKASKEKVLYRFQSGADGAFPFSGLVSIDNRLYGTTRSGGNGGGSGCAGSGGGCGTVFDVSTSGDEQVLYTFKGGADGALPWSGLLAMRSKLYGTTQSGGLTGSGCSPNSSCGTLFEVSTSGTKRILHNFSGSPKDGADPVGGLISVNGLLYGTTDEGGSCNKACGTVFDVNPSSGKESILYNFQGGTDGLNPGASLTSMNGMLYGTTTFGGASTCGTSGYGCGTVFEVNPSTGKERVLYSFKGTPDGEYTQAALIGGRPDLRG
jgi:uncharacterized repeat protein (TIGR03803 family)